MLPATKIKEFQKLYQQCFGEQISYEEAQSKGEHLISFIRIALRHRRRQREKVYGK